MTSTERAGAPDAAPIPHASAVSIVPARGPVATSFEARRNGLWLELTLHAPDISEERFRYRVRRRYLMVWEDESLLGRHHMVVLPEPVDSREAQVRFSNGVVDARLRLERR